ncbi:ATP-binding protein [Cohnella sp. GCM10027633]|uniref:ATP-binding protein n=1 Tax=unclassified Cohnella TaxID=2636738 RepID=UPI00362979A2
MKERSGGTRLTKLSLRAAIWLALVFVVTGCAAIEGKSGGQEPAPAAANGVIDLSERDWEREGVVPLNGQWRFAWLDDLGQGASESGETTIKVPGTWGTMPTGDGRKLSDQGHAVYRLTVKHMPRDAQMAIRVPNISTAYRLYVDGKLTAARGVAGSDEAGTTPFQAPATVYFDASKANTELELYVSNYDHRRGGIRTELVIGLEDQIKSLNYRHEAQELIVFGCLIMIGFYHFGLYVLRRQEIANLLFTLLCLFVALRMGMIGEGFLVQWMPGYTWTLSLRTEYIALVLSGWAGFGYFRRMYPEEIRRSWFVAAGWGAAALVLFTAVLPPIFFTSCLIVYQAYILLCGVVTLVALIASGVRRREGAKLALVGFAGFFGTIVNDMLFYNGWWRTIDLVSFGLLFLIVMNSFIISHRFSQTYGRVETMSAELIDWNNSLERKIAERTEELQRSYAEVERAKSELERMELARRQLVSNISHDLRTPITLLQGYLEALRDRVITDESQRDATIRLMLTKVEGLDALIQDLFEISVLEARKVELLVDRLALSDWRETLLEQYGLELEQRGIGFDCRLEQEGIDSLTVSIDIQRMNRVFANLIYNAVRYTPEGGGIEISISADRPGGYASLVVADCGPGLDDEDIPHLFNRFYRNDKSRHSQSGGSGLGLAIVKEIVELHGGAIRAYNGPGGGGRFEIRLPLASGETRHAAG